LGTFFSENAGCISNYYTELHVLSDGFQNMFAQLFKSSSCSNVL